jgi:hypothetical protein
MPEDVVNRLLAQAAKAAAIVLLPMPCLVPDDHVADKHRLEGLAHALGRQLAGQLPCKADVKEGRLLEPRPVLGDPPEVKG